MKDKLTLKNEDVIMINDTPISGKLVNILSELETVSRPSELIKNLARDVIYCSTIEEGEVITAPILSDSTVVLTNYIMDILAEQDKINEN